MLSVNTVRTCLLFTFFTTKIQTADTSTTTTTPPTSTLSISPETSTITNPATSISTLSLLTFTTTFPSMTSSTAASTAASESTNASTLGSTSTTTSSLATSTISDTVSSADTATTSDKPSTSDTASISTSDSASTSASMSTSDSTSDTAGTATLVTHTTDSGSESSGPVETLTDTTTTVTASSQDPAESPGTSENPGTDVTSVSGSSHQTISSEMTSQTTSSPTTTTLSTPSPPQQATKLPVRQNFELTLRIGINPTAETIYCTNCNRSEILTQLRESFGNQDGYLYVRLRNEETSNRYKRDASPPHLVFDLYFESSTLVLEPAENKTGRLWSALNDFNSTLDDVMVQDSARDTIARFAESTSSQCQIEGVCPLGYYCQTLALGQGRCYHLCELLHCGQHGHCSLDITGQGANLTYCQCNSDYDFTYSGPKCESKSVSKTKVVAIVSGVLGMLCAVCLLVIIILCCQRRNSDQNMYAVGARNNSADLGMNKL